MIKMSYTSKILKQGYRVDVDGSLHKYFNDEMVGVSTDKELYAEDESTAYNLIEKWNMNDKYHEHVVVDVHRIAKYEIPLDTYFHDTVFSGSIFKG